MPELSVIIPTFNESSNIEVMVNKIASVLLEVDYEIIFVDDHSPDGTAETVRKLAKTNSRVRCIERLGRRGLSSACIEGFLSSSAPFLAVMDADGQHDEKLLFQMLMLLKTEKICLVNASRYMAGGNMECLKGNRIAISKMATRAANFLLKNKVSDPMSGFFMFRRLDIAPIFPKISAQGFKILLDILVNLPEQCRVKELPYIMNRRMHGESKLDLMVSLEFFWVFIEKITGQHISRKFISFVLVGFSGVFVQLLTLNLCHNVFKIDFLISQSIATFIAMTSNFFLNNQFTYRNQRLQGFQIIKGLFSFYLACSLGALINIQFADMLFESGLSWWFSGVSGAIVGAVWNYTMTKVFTWKA